ncbi:MAG: hypothetical protein RLZZ571_1193 [Actinomycetota bacterium]
MSKGKPTTLVIGAGLIGTSIAMGLVKAGYTVFIDDTDPHAIDIATTRSGAKKLGSESIDLVVVATPPSKVADVMRAAVSAHPTAVVTDVASVKGTILGALATLDQEQLERIVGGHPMAGREVSGATAAQNNLFVDRSWVVTKLPKTTQSSIDLVKQMISDLGALPIDREIADHDLAVALISHTPQVVASVLAGVLNEANKEHIALAGQGLRDTIRIASADAKLWTDILANNAANVSDQVSKVAKHLEEIAKAIKEEKLSAISDMLDRGAKGRDLLPGKHGSANKQDSLIVVRVEDKPGELARLFNVAASANVNLEDVRIDHSLGRMTGLVELTVGQDKRDALVGALTTADFVVVN